MRKRITDEEKVAKRLADMISDLRLDLEMISLYISQISPNVTINRILLMAEFLKEEKEGTQNDYDYL
jgi:Flp pilus assembly CpaE family ATPase